MKTSLAGWLLNAAFFIALLASGQRANAQPRPTAPQILPHTTLAVVRVPDTQLLVDRFRSTAIGQIGNDPRIKPLVGQMYQSAQDAFKQIETQIGLPLDQILKIPQGEVCVAFVAPPDLDQPAGVVVIVDTKDQVASARKLIAAAEQIAQKRGGGRAVERFGKEEIQIFTGLAPVPTYAIEREGIFVFASARPLIETAAANYAGSGIEKTLAESDKFSTVMNRCYDAGEEPHLMWYVDPIALVRRLASGSLAATGLALFPVLGLDGLQAVGGSMKFAGPELDEVQHVHILLDNPRMGVIDAVALGSGDMNPESWVPGDCISYSTLHWNVHKTMHVASRLFNGIMGDGELERQIRTRVSEPLGADFETDVLPLLTGRLTHVQWVERPVRINSVTTMVGVQLKDAQAFRPVLDKILQRHAARVEKQRYGAFDYWLLKVGGNRQREVGGTLRQPLPCVGIIGDCLVMTDSLKAYQEAVTAQTNPDHNLANALDFKLIANKISRQPGGDAPAALQFSRPEEGLRFWYDLAVSEQTRKRLSERAEKNRFFGSLNQALTDNPLPPFSVLSEYLAPGGGMITSDETGIHYMTFTLKRK